MYRWCILSLFLLLAGCAGTPDELPTAKELYEEATQLYREARYAESDEKFDELASTFPTSPYSQQSLLDRIYYYLDRREYALALSTADQFIARYPNHAKTPYAIYMKGIIHFREDRGILDIVGQQDPSSRDTRLMRLAFDAFRELVENYPESPYSLDATKRMRYLINALAKNEIHVANYYYNRGAYSAVISRAQEVLEVYSDSTSTEEALILLIDAYEQLGAQKAAADILRILEINFPQSIYFERDAS